MKLKVAIFQEIMIMWFLLQFPGGTFSKWQLLPLLIAYLYNGGAIAYHLTMNKKFLGTDKKTSQDD